MYLLRYSTDCTETSSADLLSEFPPTGNKKGNGLKKIGRGRKGALGRAKRREETKT
jgi:hypothetical protein